MDLEGKVMTEGGVEGLERIGNEVGGKLGWKKGRTFGLIRMGRIGLIEYGKGRFLE